MQEPEKKWQEIEEGRFFALISYISFLCIVSLVLKKDNKFAAYHAKQGLALFVMEVVTLIISILPLLGPVLKFLGAIIFSLVSIWGIFQVLMGNRARIPVISDIAEKIVL